MEVISYTVVDQRRFHAYDQRSNLRGKTNLTQHSNHDDRAQQRPMAGNRVRYGGVSWPLIKHHRLPRELAIGIQRAGGRAVRLFALPKTFDNSYLGNGVATDPQPCPNLRKIRPTCLRQSKER